MFHFEGKREMPSFLQCKQGRINLTDFILQLTLTTVVMYPTYGHTHLQAVWLSSFSSNFIPRFVGSFDSEANN
jgi:hypothetical protein